MQSEGQTTQDSWFILRGDMKFGPYQYRVMLSMLQTGELFDYNYIWAPHMSGWTLLGDTPEFSKEQLLRIVGGQDALAEVFKKRSCPRARIEVPVYAHNNHRLIDGSTLSVSENGALLLLNDPLLLPGHSLFLHFGESDHNPESFNIKAEVIRKNYSRERLNVKSGLHYAVRFQQVQETGVLRLKQWTAA